MLPTIEWKGKHIRMIDQRKLPAKVEWVVCRDDKDVVGAIRSMVIRGAPAIGVAAAMGLALGAGSVKAASHDGFRNRFLKMADRMVKARPTAVNLRWAVERMTLLVENMSGMPQEKIKIALRQESEKILSEDIEINQKIGEHGQRIVPKRATILTHCNAGSLATGGYGTALGVIRAAHEAGKKIEVIADETRPWLQGLRLTAFELMEDGIPVTVIADSAAGSLMRQGKVDLVITGADRVAGQRRRGEQDRHLSSGGSRQGEQNPILRGCSPFHDRCENQVRRNDPGGRERFHGDISFQEDSGGPSRSEGFQSGF